MKFVTLFSVALSAVQAANVVINWKITYVEGVNPDNQFPRRVIGVNGRWPVPAINANINDTLIVNVENGLDVPTALHTHGLFHNGTAYNDGAPGITECGIAPGSKHTYTIPLSQSGTYWIHGHRNGQYVDGLQAPLVIRDPTDIVTYKYDGEYTIPLTDWYHEQHSVLLDQFLSIFNPGGAEPTPNTALINHGDLSGLKFEAGKTYRLRFIAMTAQGSFNVYMDDHKFRVIEVDGERVQPSETDVIHLGAAQRLSVLVTAKPAATLNYNLHANLDPAMLPGNCATPNGTLPVIYKAGAPAFGEGQPSDYPSDPMAFDTNKFTPLVPAPPVVPDASYRFDVDFKLYDDSFNHGAFNYNIFEFPKVPSLFTALSMGDRASNPTVYGPRTQATVLKSNQMVEIVINNKDGGAHPFHLHGHKFQVVAYGEGEYDAVKSADAIAANPNPTRRDTVIVQGSSYVVIRFRADNPGVWLMHCHIEWHLQAGLATIFVEAPELIQKNVKVPQANLDQCKVLNVKTTGNAAGFDDLVTFTGISNTPGLYPEYLQAKGYISLTACVVSALIGLAAVLWYTSSDVAAAKPQ